MNENIPNKTYYKIYRFFGGDVDKTITWFQTPNHSLGGVTPIEMIRNGRIDKLNQFIDQSLDGISF